MKKRMTISLKQIRCFVAAVLDLGVAWNAHQQLSEAEMKFLDYLKSEGAALAT